MELENKVNKDLLKSFIIILCPGLIALTPAILIVINTFPHVKDFISQHSFTSTLLMFAFSTTVGVIFENIGSRIEDYLCRRFTSEKEQEIWYKYLCITFEREPVGQSYLRTVLLRCKFELSMISSVPLFSVGLSYFLLKHFTLLYPIVTILVITAGTVVSVYYFYSEAKNNVKILAKVREELVKKYHKSEQVSEEKEVMMY